VSHAVSLIPKLPIVEIMVTVLFDGTVNVKPVEVHGNEEEDGAASGCVNVATNVFIVEGDVAPGTSASQVGTHY